MARDGDCILGKVPAHYQIGFRVTPERDEELRELARASKVSLTKLINRLLDEALRARVAKVSL